MTRLPNGDVIPSHVDTGYTPTYDSGDAFSNVALRFGEVQEIVYPDDDRSLSKKFVEYRVYVQERSNGSGNGRMYEHVLLMNSLAGVSDKSFYTLRGEKSATKTKDHRLGFGSKVLILCINGETNNAVIIGGLRDQKDDSEEKSKAKDLGHHLYWIFNGISAYIDADGQLVVQYNGKTDADGKRNKDVDKKVTGTRMAFLKDGSWNVNTRNPDNQDEQEQFIFLDHKNHEISQQAKKRLHLEVTDGKAEIKAKSGVHLNDATDYMLLGKSYRDAQKQMNQTVSKLLQQAAVQLSAAVSTAPGAPLPQVQAAGQLLLQAAQAIDQFESKAEAQNGFLSKHHKND